MVLSSGMLSPGAQLPYHEEATLTRVESLYWYSTSLSMKEPSDDSRFLPRSRCHGAEVSGAAWALSRFLTLRVYTLVTFLISTKFLTEAP